MNRQLIINGDQTMLKKRTRRRREGKNKKTPKILTMTFLMKAKSM